MIFPVALFCEYFCLRRVSSVIYFSSNFQHKKTALAEEKSEREREKLIKVIFCKYIWEIRTGNPSLAGKILNGTPRPILPRQKAWLEITSDNHS